MFDYDSPYALAIFEGPYFLEPMNNEMLKPKSPKDDFLMRVDVLITSENAKNAIIAGHAPYLGLADHKPIEWYSGPVAEQFRK